MGNIETERGLRSVGEEIVKNRLPEKSEILVRMKVLKSLGSGDLVGSNDLKENQKWTGKYLGTNFELTKTGDGLLNDKDSDQTVVLLDLKGKRAGKKPLRDRFVSAIGEPTVEGEGKKHNTRYSIIWMNRQLTK